MNIIQRAFGENGFFTLGKLASGLMDNTRNGLKNAPMEYKWLVTCLIAAMWCIAFGIFTAELLFIGYNIIGHLALITTAFFTFFVFTTEKGRAPKAPPNKVRWDLEREG